MNFKLLNQNTDWDIIGDIHGHADALKQLLHKLGYSLNNGTYTHPTRKVLFLGDLIDRGPDVMGVLKIVRSMCDAGAAICIMGNHEFNYIQYNTNKLPKIDYGEKLKDSEYLRKHSEDNQKQVAATQKAFADSGEDKNEWLDWFKTLPLFVENKDIRAVHAFWCTDSVAYLKHFLSENNTINTEQIHESAVPHTRCFAATDAVLKGKEQKLPEGVYFYDKEGKKRHNARIAWWKPKGTALPGLILGAELLAEEVKTMEPFREIIEQAMYSPTDKPVFFGHYWLTGPPHLTSPNAVCLDFSVAKGGHLTAYRFSGETELSANNLVWVSAND